MRLRDLQNEFIQGMHNDQVHPLLQNLHVYCDSIQGTLQKSLKEIYPVCLRLVGNDFFIFMMNHYIQKTPSYTPDLADYGHTFSEFIHQFEPVSTLPYLSDVARLEWAWHQSHYAPRSQPLDYHKLNEAYQAENHTIQFQLQPSCILLTSPYPILAIWEANQPSPINNETIITLEPNKIFYLILWQHRDTMRIALISEIEWQTLNWLQQPLTLKKLHAKFNHSFPTNSFQEILLPIVQNEWVMIHS